MQRHRTTRFLAVLTLPMLLALPSSASAQGFGINEIGTCAASRSFAVTGAPCQDASFVFWNPGMTAPHRGWSVLAGVAAIMIGGEFKQDTTFREFESDAPTGFPPHLFVSYRPENSKLSYALGLYAPYGLTSQWTDSFPGRFVAKKASLGSIYLQPNVSYAINDKWSVGGGPVFAYSTVELIQALDLSEQATTTPGVTFGQLGIPRRTEFARAHLEGSGTGFGAHIGLFGRPTADWSVGIRFLTRIDIDYDGAEAEFTQVQTGLILPPGNPINPGAAVNVDAVLAPQFTTGGRLTSQGVETKISHPAQVQAGFGYSGFADWLLSADYSWTGWRAFKELPIEFQGPANVSNRVLIEDWNNTSSVRVSAQRSFTGGAQARVGFSGVASAAPDETVTPLLPEQDRVYASIGGSYPITKVFTVEGAFLRVMSGGKRGRVVDRSSRNQTAVQLNSGVYDVHANVFSISLKANF
jgi:long-chain fatty acid transport protein